MPQIGHRAVSKSFVIAGGSIYWDEGVIALFDEVRDLLRLPPENCKSVVLLLVHVVSICFDIESRL